MVYKCAFGIKLSNRTFSPKKTLQRHPVGPQPDSILEHINSGKFIIMEIMGIIRIIRKFRIYNNLKVHSSQPRDVA